MACIRKYRGSWVVDWRDPSTKKRTIEAVADKDSAERRLAEVIQTGKLGASKRITFKERGDWWLENVAKSQIKASTYQEYESVLRKHVYPLIGSSAFAKVSRQSIKAIIAKKKAEGCSQSTIRNILAPVRGIFFDAMDSGVAHGNLATRIGKLTKASKDQEADKPVRKITPLTRAEVSVLLAKAAKSAEAVKHYPLLLCALRTGMRQGELIALKPTMSTLRKVLSMSSVTYPAAGSARPRAARTAKSICQPNSPKCSRRCFQNGVPRPLKPRLRSRTGSG